MRAIRILCSLALVVALVGVGSTPRSAAASLRQAGECADLTVTAELGSNALDLAIQSANACIGHQTIRIADGRYGPQRQAITDSVTIEGADPAAPPTVNAGAGTLFSVNGVDGPVILRNLSVSAALRAGLLFARRSHVELDGIELVGRTTTCGVSTPGAVTADSATIIVRDSSITDSGCSGISAYNDSDVIIERTEIARMSSFGVRVVGSLTVIESTIHDNGQDGVSITGAENTVVIENSSIYGNRGTGVSSTAQLNLSDSVVGIAPNGSIGLSGRAGIPAGNTGVGVSISGPGAVLTDVEIAHNDAGGVRVNAVDEAVTLSNLDIHDNGGPGVSAAAPVDVSATSIIGNVPDCVRPGSVRDRGDNVDGDGTCPFASNEPPVAVDDAIETGHSSIATIPVVANDTDPEGDDLIVIGIIQEAANGTATIEPGGELIQYLADDEFVGEDTFVYEVTDGLATATASVAVSVLPEIVIGDAEGTEGDPGDDNTVTVPVSVTPASVAPVSFEVTYIDVTALAGVDYVDDEDAFFLSTSTVDATIDVPILSDVLIEGDETFAIEISDPFGAVVVDGSATVTIRDDDGSVVSFVDSDTVSVSEGVGAATLPVTLSAPFSSPVSVGWRVVEEPGLGGVARVGSDIETASGTIDFASGETTAAIEIDIVDDDIAEDLEGFFVELHDPSTDLLGVGAAALVTIDDDDVPTVTATIVAGPSVVEPDGEATATVALSGPLPFVSIVGWAVTPPVAAFGAADPATDLTAGSGSVVVPAGATEVAFTIGLVDDDEWEGTETIDLQPTEATDSIELGPGAIVEVGDPEDAALLTFSPATAEEGGDAVELVMTASKSSPHAFSISMRPSSSASDAPGSATPGLDVAAGDIGFALEPGETTATATLAITDDDLVEGEEILDFQFVVASHHDPYPGLDVGDVVFSLTIVDDDQPDDAPIDAPPVADPEPGEPSPPEGPDRGEVGDTFLDGLDDFCPGLRQWFADIVPTAAFPTIDEYFDFDAAGCLPAWRDGAGDQTWDEFLDWLRSLGADVDDRTAPQPPIANDDIVRLQSGATVVVNVTTNDHDPAKRVLRVSSHDVGIDGLSIDITPQGEATITANDDFTGVGVADYTLCAPDDSCATATITIFVTADAPPPTLVGDYASVRAGDSRGPLGTLSPPNVLINDGPATQAIDGADLPLTLDHVDQTGDPAIDGWTGSGAVSIDATAMTNDDLVTQVVAYTACFESSTCADSTLTLLVNGLDAPTVRDDQVNVGHTLSARVDVQANDGSIDGDEGAARGTVVDTEIPPESAGLILAAEPTANGEIDITVDALLDGNAQLLYTSCLPAAAGGPDDVPVHDPERCATGVVTVWSVDRQGPIANDDTFQLAATAFLTGTHLDVHGAEGGGSDDGSRHGAASRFASPSADSVANDSIAVDATDSTGATFTVGNVRVDDGKLLLVGDVPDDPADIRLPAPGTQSSFEYQLCDVQVSTDPYWQPLCDVATVTIKWTEAIGASVEPVPPVIVPIVEASAGRWVVADAESGTVTIPVNVTLPSLDYVASVSDTVIDTSEIMTVEVDPAHGTVEINETGEVEFSPRDPRPGQPAGGVLITVTVDEYVSTATAELRVVFVEPGHATVVTSPAVSGPTDIDLSKGDIVVPSTLDGSATARLTMVAGVAIDDLPVDVPGGSVESADEMMIHFVPDADAPATIALPYSICNTIAGTSAGPLDADGTWQPAVEFTDERCAVGGALLRIVDDVGAGATGGPSGFDNADLGPAFDVSPSAAARFDPDDPGFEVRFERDLDELLRDPTFSGTDIDQTTSTVLDGLVDVFGLDATVVWSADVNVLLVAGVDTDGFYVDGQSAITIVVRGGGALSGIREIGGVPVSTAASISGDLTIVVGPDQPGTRFRVDGGGVGEVLTTSYDGLVGVATSFATGPVEAWPVIALDIGGSDDEPTVESTHAMPVTLTLPGLDGDDGEPILLRLSGQVDDGVLRIVGGANVPPGAVLSGFGVSDFAVDVAVSSGPVSGTVAGNLDVAALGISIPISVEFDGPIVSATASIPVGEIDSDHALSGILSLSSDATLDVSFVGDIGSGDFSGSIEFSATSATVLPGNELGEFAATGIEGVVRPDGTAELTALSIAGTALGHTITVTGTLDEPAATITLGPDEAVPIVKLTDVVATVVDGGIEVTLADVRFYRDGNVTIGQGCLAAETGVGDVIGLGGIVPFDVTSACVDGDVVMVSGFFDFAKFADLPFTPTLRIATDGAVTEIDDTTDPDNSFDLTFDRGTLLPIDLAEVRLGFSDLEFDGVTGDGHIRILPGNASAPVSSFDGSVTLTGDVGFGSVSTIGSFSGDVTVTDDGFAAVIDLQLDVSGDLGGLVTLDSNTLEFEMTIGSDDDAALTATGPTLKNADLSGCLVVPGLSSEGCPNGVEVDAAYSTGQWTFTAAANADLGALEVTGFTGSVVVDVTGDEPTITASELKAASISGNLAGIFSIGAGPVDLNIDRDPLTPLIEPIEQITATISDGQSNPILTGTINGFTVRDDGTVGLDSVAVTANIDTMDVADILPVSDVTVTIELPDGADAAVPDQFVVEVSGNFDLAALDEFGPIASIGGDANCLVDEPNNGFGPLRLAVDSLSEGRFRFLDAGPVTLGLCNVEIGPLAFGGSISLGSYIDGEFDGIVSGSFTAAADTQILDADVSLGVTGQFGTNDEGSTTLTITGDPDALPPTGLEASVSIAGTVEIVGARIGFDLGLTLETQGAGPELSITDVAAHSMSADLVEVAVGDQLTFTIENPEFPLVDGLFIRIPEDGSAGVAFRTPGESEDQAIEGWGGSVSGFEIGLDGRIYLLKGFGITLTVGKSGIPDWVPLDVTKAGIVFNDKTPDQIVGAIGVGERVALAEVVDDLSDVTITLSAAIDGTGDSSGFPIKTSVDDLSVNIAYLREWLAWINAGAHPTDAPPHFPVTNLDGLYFGIEQLELGPVEISGGLGFGIVDTDAGPKLWGRIVGGFVYDGFGMGVDLVVTEYGPISLSVDAPAAMVIGQTGIVVAVTSAGASFDRSIPSVCTSFENGAFTCCPTDGDAADQCDGSIDPLDVADMPSFGTAALTSIDEINGAIAKHFEGGGDEGVGDLATILPSSFTIGIEGTVTHLAVAGQLSGDIGLVLSFDQPTQALPLPGVRAIGTAQLDVYGMSIVSGRLYYDASDPLAPALTLAGSIPGDDGLLDLLVPAQAEAAITIDSAGLYAGPLLATRELALQLASAGAQNATIQEVLGPRIDAFLTRVNAKPSMETPRPALAELLLDLNGNGIVDPDEEIALTRETFAARVLDLLEPADTKPDTGGVEKTDSELLVTQTVEDLRVAAQFSVALLSDLMSGGLPTPAESTEAGTGTGDTELLDLVEAATDVTISLLRNSPEVFEVFYDTINPALIINGAFQYELFDIPLGDPAVEALLVVNKEGVYVQFAQSVLAAALGSAGLPLPIADHTTVTLDAPFAYRELIEIASNAGAGDEWFNGLLDLLDPTTGSWAMMLDSDFFVVGFEAANVDGIIVPGDSATQVDRWVATTWPPTNGIPHTDRPQVPTRLSKSGGLFASGALRVPDLVTDPVRWLADASEAIDTFPEELLEVPGHIQTHAEILLADQDAGSLRVYLPAPTPKEITSGSTAFLDKAEVTAALDVRLFGYDMAEVDLELTPLGAVGTVEFPFIDAEVTATVNHATLVDATTGVEVDWPSISIDETIDADDVREMLDAVGFDAALPPDFGFTARLRAFSPMSHLAHPDPDGIADPLQVAGGIEIVLTADTPGVIDGGEIVIRVGFGEGGGLLPSSVKLSVGADSFDFGGVTIGDAELTFTYDGSIRSVDITVDGMIEALGTTVAVKGSLSDGELNGEIEKAMDLGFGLTATSPKNETEGPEISLDYDAATGLAKVTVEGRLYIDGWDGRATIDTAITSSGQALSIDLSPGLSRGGLKITGGASIAISVHGFEIELIDATLLLLGADVSVGVTGAITDSGVESLKISADGFDLAPGLHLACVDLDVTARTDENGEPVFGIDGSATVVVTGMTEFSLPTGPSFNPGGLGATPLVPPGQTGGCDVDGIKGTLDLDGNGYGSIGLTAESLLFGPVGVDVEQATIFRNPTGAGVAVEGSVNVLGTSMSIDGLLGIGFAGPFGYIELGDDPPDLFEWELDGTMRLGVWPSGNNFRIDGTIIPPGTGPINVEGSIETNGDFDLAVTSDGITIASVLDVAGEMTLSRVGNAMKLSIADATFTVEPFGPLSADEVVIESSGRVKLDKVNIPKIGNDDLSLSAARLDIERLEAGTLTARLQGSVTGRYLNQRTIPIDISKTLSTGSSFSETITVTDGLDLGPAFKIDPIEFEVVLGSTGLDVDQVDDVDGDGVDDPVEVETLGGSTLTLSNFDLHVGPTDGATLDGELKGKLKVLGRTISTADFAISNAGDEMKFTLAASDNEKIGLGDLGQSEVYGWFRSNGHFEFTVAVDYTFGEPDEPSAPYASAAGNASLAFGADGPSASFSGEVCLAVFELGSLLIQVPLIGDVPALQQAAAAFSFKKCGTTTGTLSSNNVLSGTVGLDGTDFAFNFPPGKTPVNTENSSPVLANLPGTVFAEVRADSGEFANVLYADLIDPTAGDAEVTCTPPSGGVFEVDATTSVECVAVSSGGTATKQFDLVVTRAAASSLRWSDGSTAGDKGTAGEPIVGVLQTLALGASADAGTTGRIVMHSRPVELASFQVDDAGNWDTTVMIPDIEPGMHTLVIDTVVDGRRTLLQIPVQVVRQPIGTLPVSGRGSSHVLAIGTILLLLGLVVRRSSRRVA